MKTEIVPAAEIGQALHILKNGGIVAFPTDTVYGLGSLAFNNAAIESIYTAKDRPARKSHSHFDCGPERPRQGCG